MPNGDGNENGRKNNRPNKQKKRDNFARAAHFFVHFFAVVLHDYVLTCTFYSFYGGNSVCADLFLTCSRLF